MRLIRILLGWLKGLFKKDSLAFDSVLRKLEIYSIERITPGRRHVWLNTNMGLIRKPLGSFIIKT